MRAYNLESKVANYPRVIVDNTVISEIVSAGLFDDYIREDFDGLHFLNFLCNCHFCGEMLREGFLMMQKECGANASEKLFQKLFWHMNFVNRELDRKTNGRIKSFA